jgi:hypothetical protein
LKDEIINTHQHVFPTTMITLPNVSILGTQAMNIGICHTTIHVNDPITWLQPITLVVPSKTSMLPTSTYPMWYNVIPPFAPLNLSLYLAYQTGAKGLDYLIFKIYTSYVLGNVYLVPKQPIVPPTYVPYSIRNQLPTMVQSVTNKDRQLV